MPTGLLGVKWLMSVEEVKKIRPDIKLEKKTEYSETAEVFGKKALVVYNFSRESGSLMLILVNILGDASDEEYEELHKRLVRDYGEMTPIAPEKDIIRSSIRVKGGFALEDKLKGVSGRQFLQILMYMNVDP